MFLRRHFMQLNVETLKGIQDIHNAVHNGLWSWNTTARTLTMSDMMVMFGYIYHQLRPCHLASDMGIKIKTVNSFLYSGLVKNGLKAQMSNCWQSTKADENSLIPSQHITIISLFILGTEGQ